MKIGISFNPYGTTYGRYGKEKFAKIKQHGYSAVDYDIADTDIELYHVSETDLKAKIKEEKKAAESADIVISQLHGPWRWPPQDSTKAERAERLEKMKKSVVITALLGCKNLVIHPIMPYGIEDIPCHKENETRKLNLAFFRELVSFAKEYDVIINLENMPMPQFSLASPEQILNFVKEIHDEHLQICFDTGHVSVFPSLSVGNEIRRLGHYIKTFHIHDNNGERDEHLPPTQGIIDWSDFAKAIEDIGYADVLSLETSFSKGTDNSQFEQESTALYNLFNNLIK